MSILTDCACRSAKRALRMGFRRVLLVASEDGAGKARMALAGVLPQGSRCNDRGVWEVPDGATVEVYRYSDDVPLHEGPVAFRVCHGGGDLSSEEVRDVQRWRQALPTLAA